MRKIVAEKNINEIDLYLDNDLRMANFDFDKMNKPIIFNVDWLNALNNNETWNQLIPRALRQQCQLNKIPYVVFDKKQNKYVAITWEQLDKYLDLLEDKTFNKQYVQDLSKERSR